VYALYHINILFYFILDARHIPYKANFDSRMILANNHLMSLCVILSKTWN